MRLYSVFAVAAALAAGARAKPPPEPTAPAQGVQPGYVANFRVFGEKGCRDKNLGVWTVILEDEPPGTCSDFNGNVVKSLSLNDINADSTMYVYTDTECTAGGKTVPVLLCTEAEDEWRSWSMGYNYSRESTEPVA